MAFPCFPRGTKRLCDTEPGRKEWRKQRGQPREGAAAWVACHQDAWFESYPVKQWLWDSEQLGELF